MGKEANPFLPDPYRRVLINGTGRMCYVHAVCVTVVECPQNNGLRLVLLNCIGVSAVLIWPGDARAPV